MNFDFKGGNLTENIRIPLRLKPFLKTQNFMKNNVVKRIVGRNKIKVVIKNPREGVDYRRLSMSLSLFLSEEEVFDYLREKSKMIARALGVPFKELDDMLLESRLGALGIKEPELLELFKDIPSLPKKDKRAIINVYLKVKERRQKRKS